MKYSVMRGAFTKKNIESYVNALLSGREALFDLKKLPKIKSVNSWDGKDAKPAVYDDDL